MNAAHIFTYIVTDPNGEQVISFHTLAEAVSHLRNVPEANRGDYSIVHYDHEGRRIGEFDHNGLQK